MGLGSAFEMPLAEARERADAARRQIRDGTDPLDARRAARAAKSTTFAEAAEALIESRRPGWRGLRVASQWTSSLTLHVKEDIGSMPVAEVGTEHILQILTPIWQTKTTTAATLRTRIEAVLDYAVVRRWRPEGLNPARWKGHLDNALPPPAKVTKVKHHAAVPLQDVPALIDNLVAMQGITAKAVRFTCYTVARSVEVRKAVWSEIDMDARVWKIPAARMKVGQEHRVPLSDAAMAVLEEMAPFRGMRNDGIIFPSPRNRILSDVALLKALKTGARDDTMTLHGLRSTFRDWVAEKTAYPNELAEMALAHIVGGVEGAYRRGDMLERRRPMMEEWARVCTASAS